MPSEELQLLIAGYVLGDLDPAEAVEFERLLATNPAIAAELAQMQAALEQSYAPPELAPPPHLRAAVLGAIDSQVGSLVNVQTDSPDASQIVPRSGQSPIPAPLPVTPLPTTPPPDVQSTRSPFLWNRAWGAAAAVLIAALGFSNYQLWQTLQVTRTDDSQPATTLTYRLQSTEPSNMASATLVVDPDTLEAALTASNLPPPPSGKTYVLWTVLTPDAPFTVDEKNAVLTEVLEVDAQGRLDETIAVPDFYRSSQYVANVAVTLEDAAAPQAHTGAPVLITGL